MPKTTPSILIVDDESAIRTALSLEFEEMGYAVGTAENGFAALSEIGKSIPDILLSDLNMPGLSGFDLLSVVRRRFPAIRVIAMSGAFTGSEATSGLAADAFYQKGSSMGCLLKIIEALHPIELRAPPPLGSFIPRETGERSAHGPQQTLRRRASDPSASQVTPTEGF
jgi:CheY-like chemotaxis protein